MNFTETRRAGRRAEQEVYDILKQYTKHLYSNIRVDTLFTKTGDTEIDVLAAVADVLLVVEVKNVSKVEGAPCDDFWYLTGLEGGERYSTLNVLTQNRIHVRSLKDAWFANLGELPVVLSLVVVPSGAEIQPGLGKCGVLTLSEFRQQISQLTGDMSGCTYGYQLDFMAQRDNGVIVREDFVGGSHG